MDKKSGPWRITFDTNPDDCNLSCIMCEEHSPYRSVHHQGIYTKRLKRRMDISLIEEILFAAQGSSLREIIPSTMGEPLLYKYFDRIIELCNQYGLKLNLTTNGTFPIKGASAWAHLIVPVTSDVKISLNGATQQTQESIMVGSKWEEILYNIKEFIKIRDNYITNNKSYCSITLQLTFMERNVNELAGIVKLGIDLGVDRIKGHHLWTHFEELRQLSMRRNTEAIKRWNKEVVKAQKIANRYLLPNGKKIKLENIYVLDQAATHNLSPSSKCPFLGKEAWIATDGHFSPCCAPDEERRKLGDFGNLNQKTLSDIWNSEDYLQLMKEYMNHEICKSCNMRNS